jgi:hypothetical protein
MGWKSDCENCHNLRNPIHVRPQQPMPTRCAGRYRCCQSEPSPMTAIRSFCMFPCLESTWDRFSTFPKPTAHRVPSLVESPTCIEIQYIDLRGQMLPIGAHGRKSEARTCKPEIARDSTVWKQRPVWIATEKNERRRIQHSVQARNREGVHPTTDDPSRPKTSACDA